MNTGRAHRDWCKTCQAETIHTRLECCHCKTKIWPKIERVDGQSFRIAFSLERDRPRTAR